MTHNMKLWHGSFTMIRNGTKTIEMRLCDEKRSKIQLNDRITFTDVETNEQINALVISLHKYQNFEELYKHHDKISIGYSLEENADPADMLQYYSNEEIEKYGALGIEIKVI